MTTVGWILLLVFGCPIIIIFWVIVAVIIALVYDNKSHYKGGIRPLRSNRQITKASTKCTKRNVKQQIIKLR